MIEKLISEVKALGGSRSTFSSTHKEEADHDHGGSFFAKKVGDAVFRLNSIGIIAATTASYSPETGAVTRILQ